MELLLIYVGYLLTPLALLTLILYIKILVDIRTYGGGKGIAGRWGVFWPGVIVEYAKISREKNGKVGLLCYLFVFCLVCLVCLVVVFILSSIASHIEGPIYINQNVEVITKEEWISQ